MAERTTEYRNLGRKGMEIREVSETESSFRYIGYGSTFGNEYMVRDWFDEYLEVVEPGAFAKTLRDNSAKFPVLRSHAEHIGYTVDGGEDSRGVWFDHELMLDVPEARAMSALIKQAHRIGKPMGESISFHAIKDRWQEAKSRGDYKKRYIQEIRLIETSPTVFPANDAAGATEMLSLRAALRSGKIDLDMPLRALLADPAAARHTLEPGLAHSIGDTINRLRKIVGGN